MPEKGRERVWLNEYLVRIRGYDPNEMEITFDFNNTSWHKHRNPQDPTFSNIDFQAIYYSSKERMLGGCLEVIVDKQKMEAIWFRRGQ